MKEILVTLATLFAVFYVMDLNTDADLINDTAHAAWLFFSGMLTSLATGK